MIVKNNIWNIFYTIVFGALLLLLTLLYAEYNTVKSKYYTESENYTKIIKKTINSSLEEDELTLDLIILSISKNNYDKNIELFDKLLHKNSSFIGFAFLNKDGKFIYSSSNIDILKAPNLLKLDTQSYSFQKTLNSQSMVLGRTYYFKPLKTWVIPIRKTIRDSDGNILGVLATGIKIGSKYNTLGSLNIDARKNVILVTYELNNNKYYYLYNDYTKYLSSKEIYNESVPEKIISRIVYLLKDTRINSLEKLRKLGDVITIIGDNRYGQNVFISLVYMQKYDFWLSVSSETMPMYKELYIEAFVYSLIYILSMLIFYYLFNYISKAEKIKQKELTFQAEHDELTKLPNRTYLYKHLNEWREKFSGEYNVLYLDLDNFKNINDRFGHNIGDKILVDVASRLREVFLDEDMLIRQGGDEFIVLKQCMQNSVKNKNLEYIIEYVTKPYFIEDREFRIGLSIGVSSYPKDSANLQDLLSFADIAMYEAKRVKNSYCFFSQSMHKNITFKSDIEQELRGAIQNHEIWMVYQPQINADGSLHGVEALIRWKNKKLGLIGPDKFIPIAEEIGMMKELGEFITSESLNTIHKLQTKLNKKFHLSINISAIQFIEVNFTNNILQAIKRVGISNSLVTLEITESLSINNLYTVIPILHTIRDAGLNVSLDDFGTGYSSLSILKKLPINELKIDKSFVDDILYDKSANTLVNSIISIGKNFSMKTLAEGVESIEQVEELKSFSCDIFQGYYFSKPLNIEDLETFIKKEF